MLLQPLVLLLFLTAAIIAEAAETEFPGWHQILHATAIYGDPSEQSERVATIDPGIKVYIVAVHGDWLEIQSKHGRPPGFIRKNAVYTEIEAVRSEGRLIPETNPLSKEGLAPEVARDNVQRTQEKPSKFTKPEKQAPRKTRTRAEPAASKTTAVARKNGADQRTHTRTLLVVSGVGSLVLFLGWLVCRKRFARPANTEAKVFSLLPACELCGNAGLFRHTVGGLCEKCGSLVRADIDSRTPSLNVARAAFDSCNDRNEKLSLCNAIIEHLDALRAFERYRVPTTDPFPSTLIEEYRLKKDELLLQQLESELKAALEKTIETFDSTIDVSRLSAIIPRIEDLRSQLTNENWLDGFMTRVTSLISRAERYQSSFLPEYVGQESIKKRFKKQIYLAGSSKTSVFPHLLISGPLEMGKATLADEIARELVVNIRKLDNPSAVQPGDLAAALTNLEEGDHVLIEKIDTLEKAVVEVLIEALSDSRIAIEIGEGFAARQIKLELKPFTLIGTTSRPWQVDKRLGRWMIPCEMEPYSTDDIAQIIQLLGDRRELKIQMGAAELLAQHCDGLPGNAEVLVRRVRFFGAGTLTFELAKQRLAALGFNERPKNSVPLSDRLRSMSGIEFESFVADLFRKMGYGVETTQRTGDHGIDLFLTKESKLTAVQCKCWANPVGEPVLRDFLGAMISAGAQDGYVVTTSTFSSQACRFVGDKAIQLIDFDALMELAMRHGVTNRFAR